LELLAFPAGNTAPRRHNNYGRALCLGIDHSAISVSDSATSIAFYEGLGLQVSARSFNGGIEQEKLDGVAEACVEVIELNPREPAPHLELLRYQPRSGARIVYQSNDIAATRLVLDLCDRHHEGGRVAPGLITDPDGHHLLIVSDTDRRRPV
jgi:catechol 2,3-dioxygenase-like lactoylglutathione lyase family enzyme